MTQPGSRFEVDGSVGNGETLQSVSGGLSGETKAWAVQSGLLRPTPREAWGAVLVIVAAVLAGVLFVWNPSR